MHYELFFHCSRDEEKWKTNKHWILRWFSIAYLRSLFAFNCNNATSSILIFTFPAILDLKENVFQVITADRCESPGHRSQFEQNEWPTQGLQLQMRQVQGFSKWQQRDNQGTANLKVRLSFIWPGSWTWFGLKATFAACSRGCNLFISFGVIANCEQSCSDLALDNASQLAACIDGCTQAGSGNPVSQDLPPAAAPAQPALPVSQSASEASPVLPVSQDLPAPVAAEPKQQSPLIDILQDPVPAFGDASNDEDQDSSSEETNESVKMLDLSSILGGLLRPSILIHGEPLAVDSQAKDAVVAQDQSSNQVVRIDLYSRSSPSLS